MFIRVWHKSENVGREDCGIPEYYVAIATIGRFYSRKYDGDRAIRYIVVSGDDTSYMMEETFEYLKSLKLEGQACATKKKSEKKTVSVLGIPVGEVG